MTVTGSGSATRSERIADRIRVVEDFPLPGVTFRDITPLLASPDGLDDMVSELAATVSDHRVDLVAGVEARGFIVGAPVARAIGAGFIPVRKAGKLPGETVTETYALEYGEASIQVHGDAIAPGARVLVLDDVLATGGTASAACRLVERCGGVVVGVTFLLEIAALGGRRLLDGREVSSVIVV